MIDLHFHCLPDVDDGPEDWDQAVALCRAAAAEGTTILIATPHVLRDPWLNDDPAVRDRLILRLNALLEGNAIGARRVRVLLFLGHRATAGEGEGQPPDRSEPDEVPA